MTDGAGWCYRIIGDGATHTTTETLTKAELVEWLCQQYPDAPGFQVWSADDENEPQADR